MGLALSRRKSDYGRTMCPSQDCGTTSRAGGNTAAAKGDQDKLAGSSSRWVAGL